MRTKYLDRNILRGFIISSTPFIICDVISKGEQVCIIYAANGVGFQTRNIKLSEYNSVLLQREREIKLREIGL